MLKISNITRKFNLFQSLSLKNFRDYRNSQAYFRDYRYKDGNKPSPYSPQFSLTEAEREANEKLPVEERVLDWQKYMKHKGKLKYSTGVFLTDVEPFPRLKIMMLCDILMGLYKEIPEKFKYKHISYEYTKYIMKIVDENESIIDIESKLPNVASVEILIENLHNEDILIKILDVKMWDLEEQEAKDEDKQFFYFATAAFRENGNPFGSVFDDNKHKKYEKPQRPETANNNPNQNKI